MTGRRSGTPAAGIEPSALRKTGSGHRRWGRVLVSLPDFRASCLIQVKSHDLAPPRHPRSPRPGRSRPGWHPDRGRRGVVERVFRRRAGPLPPHGRRQLRCGDGGHLRHAAARGAGRRILRGRAPGGSRNARHRHRVAQRPSPGHVSRCRTRPGLPAGRALGHRARRPAASQRRPPHCGILGHVGAARGSAHCRGRGGAAPAGGADAGGGVVLAEPGTFDIPPPRYLGVGVRDAVEITVRFEAADSDMPPAGGP